MGLVPLGDDLRLAFADIGGVDPFASKPCIDVLFQLGADADVNINGTVSFADGPVMGVVGQVDDPSGLEGVSDLDVQFGQERQDAAAALVGGGDQVFDQFIALHRSDRFQPGTKRRPYMNHFGHFNNLPLYFFDCL